MNDVSRSASAEASSPYLRGDAVAGYYIGLRDVQGRTFRKWADEVRLPFTVIRGTRTYRKVDVDRMWTRHAFNQANLHGPN